MCKISHKSQHGRTFNSNFSAVQKVPKCYLWSMQRSRNILDFIVDGSFIVAFSALCMVEITAYELGFVADKSVLAFVFCSTLAGYNFVKYDNIAKVQFPKYSKFMLFILMISGLSAITSAYLFFNFNWRSQAIIAFSTLVTILYTLPFFPNRKNARNWAGAKIYIVSFTWVCITLLLPVAQDFHVIDNIFFVSIQRFLFVFTLILAFEIIDLNVDDRHLATVPQQFGVKRTKILGAICTVLLYILYLLFDNDSPISIIIATIICTALVISIFAANERRHRYYAGIWIESIPIIWLLLLKILA